MYSKDGMQACIYGTVETIGGFINFTLYNDGSLDLKTTVPFFYIHIPRYDIYAYLFILKYNYLPGE